MKVMMCNDIVPRYRKRIVMVIVGVLVLLLLLVVAVVFGHDDDRLIGMKVELFLSFRTRQCTSHRSCPEWISPRNDFARYFESTWIVSVMRHHPSLSSRDHPDVDSDRFVVAAIYHPLPQSHVNWAERTMSSTMMIPIMMTKPQLKSVIMLPVFVE